jgi:hypothetical protein
MTYIPTTELMTMRKYFVVWITPFGYGQFIDVPRSNRFTCRDSTQASCPHGQG